MISGQERRQMIMETLQEASEPLSGTALAGMFHVSRQVIVQDMALLRAEHQNILSTNKGYLLFDANKEAPMQKRVLMVHHTTDQVLEEFYSIVDLGGKVLNVSIDHEIYGQITVDLLINNRQDADEFVEKLRTSRARPLKELTEDYHYHTIAAPTTLILDHIEQELQKKGFCD